MLDKKTHIHTIERSPINPRVYRCIHPECTYFARADFLIGKRALCHKCGSEYNVSRTQLFRDKLKRPTCMRCSNSKEAQEFRNVTNKIENILEEVFPNEGEIKL